MNTLWLLNGDVILVAIERVIGKLHTIKKRVIVWEYNMGNNRMAGWSTYECMFLKTHILYYLSCNNVY